jgi:hypothetical protein
MLDFVEHPVDIRPVLARAAQLLVPGGLLVLWTPNASSFGSQDSPLALRVDLEHMQYFALSTLVWLAPVLGLAVTHLEACGEPDLSVVHPQLPGRGRSRAAVALKKLGRRVGLHALRQRLSVPTNFAERRGNYSILAILERGANKL